MTKVFSCSCGQKLQVAEQMVGKRIRCPACKSTFVVKETMRGTSIGADPVARGLEQASPTTGEPLPQAKPIHPAESGSPTAEAVGPSPLPLAVPLDVPEPVSLQSPQADSRAATPSPSPWKEFWRETGKWSNRTFQTVGRAVAQVATYYWTHRHDLWQRFLEHTPHKHVSPDRHREIRLSAQESYETAQKIEGGWEIRLPNCCVMCGAKTDADEQSETRTVPDVAWPFWAPLAGLGAGVILSLWFWTPWWLLLLFLVGLVIGYVGRGEMQVQLRLRRCEKHTTFTAIPRLMCLGENIVLYVGQEKVRQRFLRKNRAEPEIVEPFATPKPAQLAPLALDSSGPDAPLDKPIPLVETAADSALRPEAPPPLEPETIHVNGILLPDAAQSAEAQEVLTDDFVEPIPAATGDGSQAATPPAASGDASFQMVPAAKDRPSFAKPPSLPPGAFSTGAKSDSARKRVTATVKSSQLHRKCPNCGATLEPDQPFCDLCDWGRTIEKVKRNPVYWSDILSSPFQWNPVISGALSLTGLSLLLAIAGLSCLFCFGWLFVPFLLSPVLRILLQLLVHLLITGILGQYYLAMISHASRERSWYTPGWFLTGCFSVASLIISLMFGLLVALFALLLSGSVGVALSYVSTGEIPERGMLVPGLIAAIAFLVGSAYYYLMAMTVAGTTCSLAIKPFRVARWTLICWPQMTLCLLWMTFCTVLLGGLVFGVLVLDVGMTNLTAYSRHDPTRQLLGDMALIRVALVVSFSSIALYYYFFVGLFHMLGLLVRRKKTRLGWRL